VELANYTTLINPLAEVGKSLGIAINIVRTTRDAAISQRRKGEVVFLHKKAFNLRRLKYEILIRRDTL
jgi:hypothetical protein